MRTPLTINRQQMFNSTKKEDRLALAAAALVDVVSLEVDSVTQKQLFRSILKL